MTKWFWCFPTFLVLAASPVRAGDLTLFGGIQSPGNITLSEGGNQVTNPTRFGVVGIRYNSSPAFFGFEHTLAYSPDFIDPEAYGLLVGSNFIIGLPALTFRPYATAGVGLIYAGGDGPASVGARIAFNYGGGVKTSWAGPLGFRVDLRAYSVPGVQAQTLRLVEASAGLLIGF